MEDRVFYGVVKTIVRERGFGFIEHAGGRDVYFHAAEIGGDVFARLKPNQPVMFEFAKRDAQEKPAGKRGPRASVVQLIERIPGGKLSEVAPRHHPRARQRKATWKRRIEVKKDER